jgi:hypothetical protein
LTEQLVANDKDVAQAPDYHFLSRTEKYNEAIRKSAIFIRMVKEHKLDNEEIILLRE